jgi:hypothetical protein
MCLGSLSRYYPYLSAAYAGLIYVQSRRMLCRCVPARSLWRGLSPSPCSPGGLVTPGRAGSRAQSLPALAGAAVSVAPPWSAVSPQPPVEWRPRFLGGCSSPLPLPLLLLRIFRFTFTFDGLVAVAVAWWGPPASHCNLVFVSGDCMFLRSFLLFPVLGCAIRCLGK